MNLEHDHDANNQSPKLLPGKQAGCVASHKLMKPLQSNRMQPVKGVKYPITMHLIIIRD
jgi:hypothetical protein